MEVLGGVKQGQRSSVKFVRESTDFFYFQTKKNICSIELICKHDIPACSKKKKSRWATSLKTASEIRAHADELKPGCEASHSLTAEGCVGLSRAGTDSQETYTAAGGKKGLKQK